VGVPGFPWLYLDTTVSRIAGSGTPASYCFFASRATLMQIPQENPIASGETRGTSRLWSTMSMKQS
jgi:hypothetical protein